MADWLNVCDLGLVDYGEALVFQRSIRDRRIEGLPSDTLILLEHPPTITLGRRSEAQDLVIDRDGLRRLGFTVAEIERGGRVTYHGPGQVVGYVIVSLKERHLSVPRFLELLEQSVIDYLTTLGIDACRRRGLTGVWVGRRKIGAIGVHLRRWVSLHGFALNVDPDLSHYDTIVPCGIPDAEVTSICREMGHAPAPNEVKRGLAEAFSRAFVFGTVDWVEPGSLSSSTVD